MWGGGAVVARAAVRSAGGLAGGAGAKAARRAVLAKWPEPAGEWRAATVGGWAQLVAKGGGARGLATGEGHAGETGKARIKEAAPVKEKRNVFLKRWDWLLRLLGYYGKESSDIRTGQALFRSCEEQSILVSNDESFGLEFEYYDTKNFQVRQQLLMLHVWMVHRRLLVEGEHGKDLQETLFDTLWDDTTRRIRSTGVHELTVNKHLAQVQKSCFTSAVSYDHGLNIADDENLELGSAIWRNIYQSDAKTPDECVYRMADYVRNQISTLDKLSRDDLFQGKLSWIDIEAESPNLAGEWRQAVAPSGKVYYWNIKTRESRWTRPPATESTAEHTR